MWYEKLISKSLIPEFLIRIAVRIHLKYRNAKKPKDVEVLQEYINDFVYKMKSSPLAIETSKANIQHYEVPTEFFQQILGKYMKYSSGYWLDSTPKRKLSKFLTQSEEQMLKITCERAGIQSGDVVLDLGCGWGALSLYMVENYPKCQIIAVSNSQTQREYITSLIKKRNIKNLKVIKANILDFQPEQMFDKIISIEMFEHMRNYEILLEKLSSLLKSDGLLFIHIFTDKDFPYFFEINNKSEWMAKYFFRGGLMPSVDLLTYFTKDFSIEKLWKVNGTHYHKTLEAWLRKMKKNKKKIQPIFRTFYGRKNTKKGWNSWKIFFIVCSEAFKFKKGNSRFVSHYLLQKRKT